MHNVQVLSNYLVACLLLGLSIGYVHSLYVHDPERSLREPIYDAVLFLVAIYATFFFTSGVLFFNL